MELGQQKYHKTQLSDLETDCPMFDTYWVQDKARRVLISRHDFHMLAGCAWDSMRQTVWLRDRLFDMETDCTKGVKATKYQTQDTSFTCRMCMLQTVWLQETVCRTRLALGRNYDIDCLIVGQIVWLLDCLTSRQSVKKESRQQNFTRLKTQLSHASRMCMGQTA